MTQIDVIDFNSFSHGASATNHNAQSADEHSELGEDALTMPTGSVNQLSVVRIADLEAEVGLLREAMMDMIAIINKSAVEIDLLQRQITTQQTAMPGTSQQTSAKSAQPKSLKQLSDKTPYKMVGQLFQNKNKKTAPVPVYKLELCEKGHTAGGKDKPVKYSEVHCGLHPDFGLAELKKATKHQANKPFSSVIPWISQTLSALRDQAKENDALDRTAAGFFQNRKTKEILCHVVVLIDTVTMEGKLIFNSEGEGAELPFVMSRLTEYQKASRSADYINYFNVKDIRAVLGSDESEGDDCDDE